MNRTSSSVVAVLKRSFVNRGARYVVCSRLRQRWGLLAANSAISKAYLECEWISKCGNSSRSDDFSGLFWPFLIFTLSP
ncbi:hypothetical protein R1flu_013643 [Riccia fluitans]|uniref:Uncharacterized protein n=1 Tax=Riccia fluitans TaxID=41844 RepID=A0ABD1YHJ0_9MARC